MYLSVRDALHDIESLRVIEEDISCFFETWMSERARDETHDLRLSKQAAFAPDLPQSYDIIWGTKLTLNDTKPETEVYNPKIVGFNLIKMADSCFVFRLSHIWFVSHNLIYKYKFTPLFIYGLTTLK